MREVLPEYYGFSTRELAETGRDAVIAFDASFLLDLYRYSDSTAKDMFAVLGGIQDQLWLPHQCALEFLRNRLQVMGSLRTKHAELLKHIKDSGDSLIKGIETGCAKHPLLEAEKITKPLLEALQAAESKVRALGDKHLKATVQIEEDPIWQRVETLFAQNVGAAYTDDQLGDLVEKAKIRFAAKTPPGFADKKDKDWPYGDFILWQQLLDHCKALSRPAFFVTSDVKEDWWLVHQGKRLGPLTALKKEFYEVTGQKFHLYETTHFVQVYGPRFQIAPDQPIGEIRKIRDEKDRLTLRRANLKMSLLNEERHRLGLKAHRQISDADFEMLPENEKLQRAYAYERSLQSKLEAERMRQIEDAAKLWLAKEASISRQTSEQLARELELHDAASIARQVAETELVMRTVDDKERMIRSWRARQKAKASEETEE
jgi:hypothetical protein